ncbi:ATP-binding cassette domain-containing protein [Modestobacter muralis]|uniref:ATP-binding cassette domain-containing protein n=1 Tax=Modestobacter muralis TaxID=1608614 RepID=A0A6P0H927_9ACTN|nr:ATP-binding cassette domain-containing protein [Modestobacter muralis]NEK95393.1 ATP-binding cassette domain-containing protein [Modestobacter muralis]NEN52281.1 ATP-binding cassette domain-containing protein [Modestobacter muralis]
MITVDHLTKRYGARTVVSDVSFTCTPGSVTGFLGPNGAGKSTTLRALVGLTVPTSGTATIAGRAHRDLPNAGRQVGVLLDAGAQHAGRTGRETLTLTAMVLGVDTERVDEVLGQVGLAGRPAGTRVGSYSLGMRQRLGLAGALLGDPEVLVLDEPANGLDPEGIWWMRGLLRGFADRGGTVLLSSHQLREVEAVADQLVVISGGRIVAQGSKTELLGRRGTVVRGPDRAVLARALQTAGIAVSAGDDDALVADADPLAVGQAAAAAGAVLTELGQAGGEGLEELFRALTASPGTGTQQPAVAA